MNKKNVNKFNTKKLPIIIDRQNQYDLIKIKNNLITNLQFKLDLTTQGIFLYSLTQLYKFKNGVVKFKTKDLCYKTGLSYQYMRNFLSDKIYFAKNFSKLSWVTETTTKLGNKRINYEAVIPSANYNGDSKEWSITINPNLLSFFQNLQYNFFLIDLRDWKNFKCAYTLPLLALIRGEVLKTTAKIKNYTIKELKDHLGITEYSSNGVLKKDLYSKNNDFLKYAIYPAINEINAIKNDREYSGLSLPNVFNLETVNGKNKLVLNKYDKKLNPEGIVNPASFVNNFTLEKFNHLQEQGRFQSDAQYNARSILAIQFNVKDLTNYKAQKLTAAKRKKLAAEQNLAELNVLAESKGSVKSKNFSQKKNVNKNQEANKLTGKKCPQCSEGDQVIKKNNNEGKEFYACSRFPKCKYVASVDDKFIYTDLWCPECDKYREKSKLLIRKNPKNGTKFFGCSSYPECKYTEKMNEYDELKYSDGYEEQEQGNGSSKKRKKPKDGLIIR